MTEGPDPCGHGKDTAADPSPGGGALTHRFEQALIYYACHVHGGQTRKKTTIPYIGHLLGVASLVNVFREGRPVGLAEELERVARKVRELAAPTLPRPASEEESPTWVFPQNWIRVDPRIRPNRVFYLATFYHS